MYYRKNDKVIKGDHVENFELSGPSNRSFNLLKVFLVLFIFIFIMMFDVLNIRSIREIISEPPMLLFSKVVVFIIALLMLIYC